VSRETIRRWLKGQGWTWKRCRHSLKEKRDSDQFREGQRVLAAFHEREVAGELEVFYLDESGFSSSSCMPYAWQPKGETRCLSANVPGRTNVIGFLSRDHDSYFHVVDGTVTHRQVKDAMDGFIRARRPDQLTIVVMDNASIHHKAVAEGQWAWLGHKVWAWFLPAYSPELNPIEMLWKKIKYEWLPWTAYQCFETMRTALNEIFQNLGGKYRINFA